MIPAGQHRPHRRPGRGRRITVAYSVDEHSAIVAAARAAGLTPTGYVADAALAAATGAPRDLPQPLREALAELVLARTQLRRFAINVNQAVRELNTHGQAPASLGHAVQLTTRAVERVDHASVAINRHLR